VRVGGGEREESATLPIFNNKNTLVHGAAHVEEYDWSVAELQIAHYIASARQLWSSVLVCNAAFVFNHQLFFFSN